MNRAAQKYLIASNRTLGEYVPTEKPVRIEIPAAGDLAVTDATGANDVDPGFADLGARFHLVYLTAAELA